MVAIRKTVNYLLDKTLPHLLVSSYNIKLVYILMLTLGCGRVNHQEDADYLPQNSTCTPCHYQFLSHIQDRPHNRYTATIANFACSFTVTI